MEVYSSKFELGEQFSKLSILRLFGYGRAKRCRDIFTLYQQILSNVFIEQMGMEMKKLYQKSAFKKTQQKYTYTSFNLGNSFLNRRVYVFSDTAELKEAVIFSSYTNIFYVMFILSRQRRKQRNYSRNPRSKRSNRSILITV